MIPNSSFTFPGCKCVCIKKHAEKRVVRQLYVRAEHGLWAKSDPWWRAVHRLNNCLVLTPLFGDIKVEQLGDLLGASHDEGVPLVKIVAHSWYRVGPILTEQTWQWIAWWCAGGVPSRDWRAGFLICVVFQCCCHTLFSFSLDTVTRLKVVTWGILCSFYLSQFTDFWFGELMELHTLKMETTK